jgi:hypothetical protein
MNPAAPPAAPRFLCDEMLGHLCRYLRAAGYDTLLANNGRTDRELLKLCHDEGRYFLTLDSLVMEHKASAGVAVLLPQGDLDHHAATLTARFHLDWLQHAFSRCLLDNTPLVAADAAEQAQVPPDAIKPGEQLYRCPTCGRVYWRGSHYRRMRARLAGWQATPD